MSPQTPNKPARAHPSRDIIVIGGSLGAIPLLRHLLRRLPPNLQGTLLIVLHRSAHHDDQLAGLIAGDSPHRVVEPADNDPVRRGQVYLAPRDRHLIVAMGERLRLVRGPTEHFTRPAVDPLFRSAAAVYGSRVVGVILSGTGHDGVSGLIAIKAAGGFSMAQDPSEAIAASMPRRAVAEDDVDEVLPIDGIADKMWSFLTEEGSRSQR